MKNYEVRATTKERIEEITGEPFPYTARVFEVMYDEETLGFIGVYRQHNYNVLSSWIAPDIELKRYRKGVILAYRKMMEILKKQPLPVYSEADSSIDGSDRLLEHIGFYPYRGRVYQWHG